MNGAVLAKLQYPGTQLMSLGFSDLQAMRVLTDRDALMARVKSPPPFTPTPPLSFTQASVSTDAPWKKTHAQVMAWAEDYEWESKSQKKRVIAVLKEEEIKGSSLQRVAESDHDKAHKILAKWGVEDEDDRTVLIKAINSLLSSSVAPTQDSQAVSSTTATEFLVLQGKGIQVTDVLKRKLCAFLLSLMSRFAFISPN